MLVFDHLNSSLQAIFDDLFKPFKEQHSHNTREARRCALNIPKMKTSFCGSRLVEVKSIKDWNNIFNKIHFATEDFMKCSKVIIKIKNIFCDKTNYPYNYSRETSITNIGSLRHNDGSLGHNGTLLDYCHFLQTRKEP